MRVIACDPGERNFAWAYYDQTEESWCTGMFDLDTDSFDERVLMLRPQIIHVLDVFNPDVVVFERFITRQRASTVNERVNVLIGALMSVCAERSVPFRSLTAAAWKTAFTRATGVHPDYVKLPGCKVHEADALGMAAYHADSNMLRLQLTVFGLARLFSLSSRRCAAVARAKDRVCKLHNLLGEVTNGRIPV